MKQMVNTSLKTFTLLALSAGMFGLSIGAWRAFASPINSAAQTITINPETLPNASLGMNFSQHLTQSGGSGTITWSISEGSLPSGIRIDFDGLLYGQPSATGTFTFTAKATDANGLTGTRVYTLVINCLPFTIAPATFSTAIVGERYTQSFSASFDSLSGITSLSGSEASFVPVPDATFKYTLVGNLPNGLFFSQNLVVPPGYRVNQIQGTPTESGGFNFTIKASPIGNMDESCIVSRNYTLVVYDGVPPPQAQIIDTQTCTSPGDVVTVVASATNFTANSHLSNLRSSLNSTLKALPGSCTATVGACAIADSSTVLWNGTLAAGQLVTVVYKAQVSDNAEPGTPLCATTSSVVGNNPAVSMTACSRVNCQPAGPGGIAPPASEMSDQKPGSVLSYNIYTSSTEPTRQNTRINITNTHPQLPAFVHLFFVAESCAVADSYICLTGNQTASFLASDLDPGTTGYVVAVAVDYRGCPSNFNYLAGDAYVKFAPGHAANLNAQAFSVLSSGLPVCDSSSSTATITFDGISYNRVPRTLAVSSFGSRADGNDTLVILNRIGGNPGTGASTLGMLFGILYDDAESSLSFSVNGNCQLRGSLSNNFPRTTPRFETFIPAGRTGWLKISSQEPIDIGILGSQINFNANAASSSGAFNNGHNLHALTLSASNTYIIPVFPPGC